jgi:hypothetical protein
VLVPGTSRDRRTGRAPLTPRRAHVAPKCARRPCNDTQEIAKKLLRLARYKIRARHPPSPTVLCLCLCPLCRGSLLSFLGCSLDPPTFASAIRCHQKSTSNSAGSSVGSLAPPRATPRLGGVCVSCQCLPCSFVLALRELGLRLGVKAQLPLRARRSRGVPPGPGALEHGNRRLSSSWLIRPSGPKSRLETMYCFAALVLLWSRAAICTLGPRDAPWAM